MDPFVDDLDALIDLEHGRNPGQPLVLLGHSMGGLIATCAALRRTSATGEQGGAGDPAGLVLTGAAFRIGGEISAVRRWVSALLARALPDLPLLPPSPPGVLSRDPEVDRRFAADPLTYRGRIRVGMAFGMFAAGETVRAEANRLTLPLLVMHGGDDRLTDPSGSIAVHGAASSPDKTLRLWPGLRHELFNEPEGPEVIAEIIAWLDARMG